MKLNTLSGGTLELADATFGADFNETLVHQVVTRCQGTVKAENGSRGLRIRIELPLA